jgi:hypothetical protein
VLTINANRSEHATAEGGPIVGPMADRERPPRASTRGSGTTGSVTRSDGAFELDGNGEPDGAP